MKPIDQNDFNTYFKIVSEKKEIAKEQEIGKGEILKEFVNICFSSK